MNTTMAFAISTPSSSLSHHSSSTTCVKTPSPHHSSFSNYAITIPKNAIFKHIKCIPQLGITPFSQWSGLKQMGISISHYSVKIEKKGKCKGKGVYASLFGVGAPEVLVIGVVALLVFGPKGLAEVARNLGQTLRAFQPTIRELQEVSREFKSTLEREIGLDDVNDPVPKRSNTTKPTPEDKPEEPNSSENGEDSTDENLMVKADQFRGALLQLQKEQEEEKQKEQEKEREKAQSETESESQSPSQETTQALDTPQEEASSVTPPFENPDNNALQEAASVGAPTNSAPTTETQM